MKIGYCVEGSTDRAFLYGLRDRMCPEVELISGYFRSGTGLRQKKEIDLMCYELSEKEADLIIFMRDANKENWREVLRHLFELCPTEFQHITVFGVCDRNIECWICADTQWIADKTNRSAAEFSSDDPKVVFEDAMKIQAHDRKEEDIEKLIKDAPLKNWYERNPSFREFYESLWNQSKKNNCSIENIR